MDRSREEKQLLLLFNQLSQEGKSQLLERGAELYALGYTPGGKRSRKRDAEIKRIK